MTGLEDTEDFLTELVGKYPFDDAEYLLAVGRALSVFPVKVLLSGGTLGGDASFLTTLGDLLVPDVFIFCIKWIGLKLFQVIIGD